MNVSLFGGGHSSIHNRPKDTILALRKLAFMVFGKDINRPSTMREKQELSLSVSYPVNSFKGPNEGKQKSELKERRVTSSVWSRDQQHPRCMETC